MTSNPEEGEDFTSGEMRALWDRVNRGFRSYVGVLMADIQHAIDTGEIKTPLDDESRKALHERILLHAAIFLAGIGVPSPMSANPVVRQAVRARPWPIDMIETAYRLGLGSLPPSPAGTYADLPTLSPFDTHMLDLLRAQAGSLLRPLAFGIGQELERRTLAQDIKIAQAAVLEWAHGTPTRLLASYMADLAGATMAADGLPVTAGAKWDRDWRRVARTEMARARNTAALYADLRAHPVNAGWEPGQPLKVPKVLVFKIPQETRRDEKGRLLMPCQHCQRLWRVDDVTPRLYPLDQIIANGDNGNGGVGGGPRKAAEYLPTVGPIHPHCVCGPLLYYVPETLHLFPKMEDQVQAFAGQGFEGVPSKPMDAAERKAAMVQVRGIHHQIRAVK